MKSKEIKRALLRLFLVVYAFSMLLIGDMVSETHSGPNELSKNWYFFPLLCILLIEILNQFTYWLAKRSLEKAILVKGCFFWLLFTLFFTSHTYITLHAEKTGVWIFREKISAIFLLLLLSMVLPLYSLCPRIRFLFLLDGFTWRK